MSGDTLILWGGGTMRTHRTLWYAAELGIRYVHRPIQPRTGETREPEYLAINPRHKVPGMQHGDVILTESAAIMAYMNDVFPVPAGVFVPETPIERARLLEWSFFCMSELDANGLYSMRRHGDLKDTYGDSPIAVDAGRDYFLYQLDRMADTIQATGDYLMGERFSYADVLFMTCLDWARWYDIELPGWLMEWQARVGTRPAYLTTFDENYSAGFTVADVR